MISKEKPFRGSKSKIQFELMYKTHLISNFVFNIKFFMNKITIKSKSIYIILSISS